MQSNRDYATENINLKKRLEVLEKENQELRKNVKEIENLYLKENKHWCETTDNLRK